MQALDICPRYTVTADDGELMLGEMKGIQGNFFSNHKIGALIKIYIKAITIRKGLNNVI